MKTTAEYRDGVLILKDSIIPKASILHIEIPDEELLAEQMPDDSTRPDGQEGSLQEELNQILGSLARNRPSASSDQDREMLVEALAERHEL